MSSVEITSPPEAYAKSSYFPLLLLATAYAAGLTADRYAPVAAEFWWCGSLLAFSLAWMLRGRYVIAASVCLLAAVAMCGATRHHLFWRLVPSDHVACESREDAQPIAFQASVTASPRIVAAPPPSPFRPIPVGDRSRCELTITHVREGDAWRAANGRARLIVEGHLLGIHAGDVVRGFAVYQRPSPAMNPGEMDFAESERADGRLISLSAEFPECVTVLHHAAAWNPRRWIDDIRRAGDRQLRRHLSPSQSGLASAVLLGQREYLDAERNERFLVTGTIHLIAISGLNLGILVYAFWLLGRTGLWSRHATLLGAAAFAVIYALITDAEAPVVRASVLIVAICASRYSGRLTSPWNVLGGAALVVTAASPAALFQTGAQLSFLAVAVLTAIHPLVRIEPPSDPLDRLIAATRPNYVRAMKHVGAIIRQIVLVGFYVWIFTMPLVWLKYNLLSPVGVALNPIVWLPMSLALFSGFAVLLTGGLVPPIGRLAGMICEGSLQFLETAVAWSEPIRGGYAWLPAPPWWWVALFYLLLVTYRIFASGRIGKHWIAACVVVWSAFAAFWAMPIAPSPSSQKPLACTFVSVGHGAAVLVELPDGKTLLYDCGRLGSPLSGARPIAAVLWSRGITHLDSVVISHADSDHYNALPEILERFSIGAVYVSTVMWNERAAGPLALQKTLEERGVPIRELRTGDLLRTDDPRTRLEVLHPARGGVFGNDNANSIVLLLEHEGRRILLTGDLEARGLTDLLHEEPIPVEILMSPHHGSIRNNPTSLAAWCRPKFVVVSGGRHFELGQTTDEVFDAYHLTGARVFHTARDGAIRFEVSRRGIEATSFRGTSITYEASPKENSKP